MVESMEFSFLKRIKVNNFSVIYRWILRRENYFNTVYTRARVCVCEVNVWNNLVLSPLVHWNRFTTVGSRKVGYLGERRVNPWPLTRTFVPRKNSLSRSLREIEGLWIISEEKIVWIGMKWVYRRNCL